MTNFPLSTSLLPSDLFELQLQAPCDAQSQGGAKFSALTGPARGLPGGDNPQSPTGLTIHPTCLAASWSACNVPPQPTTSARRAGTQHLLSYVADGKVIAIYCRQEKQRTNGFYCCYCLLIRGRTVGLMIPCSQQRTVKVLGRLMGHRPLLWICH